MSTHAAHTTVGAQVARDVIEADVVCVGAGVASLSTALRLLKQAHAAGAPKPHIMIIEKGAFVGAHVLSGAVLDPSALDGLLTADERAGLPVASTVTRETYCRLTASHALPVPWIPPMMQAHGFPIVSLSRLTAYLGELCERHGAEIYTEMTAAGLVEDGGRVTGVQIGDKGIDKHGNRTPRFEPGPVVRAKAVVLGEGGCGFLTEQFISAHRLNAQANHQTYAIGIKELIETPSRPERAGSIIHSFGYPLGTTYGGGFVYVMDATRVALGLVIALDYHDPLINPHDLFRAFKAHPRIRRVIEGGTAVGYGAKVLPEGGCFSVPGLSAKGVLIVGDGAGLLDCLRLKGIHIAMQSGIAAGDTLLDCWKSADFSEAKLAGYTARMQAMPGWAQMKRVRNVRAWFRHGELPGMMAAGMAVTTFGTLPPGRFATALDSKEMKKKAGITPDKVRALMTPPAAPALEPKLQLDRLTDVFHSGVTHNEDQPCHLKIVAPDRCISECLPAFGAPCTRFCPGQVYSLDDDGTRIRIDFANCLHCKTCRIKDPLDNIEWLLPEGGGGPKYNSM